MESFKRVAVLDQGRIKPLDTYARNLMKRFSGGADFAQRPAIEWLAKLLFAPETTREDKVFRIKNPRLLNILGLHASRRQRYSFSEIEPNLEKLTALAESAKAIHESNRNELGTEIIRLYQNVAQYTDLANSFAFAFPHPDFQVAQEEVVRLLDLPNGRVSYSFLDIALKAPKIMAATEDLKTKEGGQKTLADAELLKLLGNLYTRSMSYDNTAFAIFPSLDPPNKGIWLSPCQAINREFQNPEVQKEIGLLHEIEN